MSSDKRWFVSVGGGAPVGPVTHDQIQRGVAAGKIPGDAVVCAEGAQEWVSVQSVLGGQPPSAPGAVRPTSASRKLVPLVATGGALAALGLIALAVSLVMCGPPKTTPEVVSAWKDQYGKLVKQMADTELIACRGSVEADTGSKLDFENEIGRLKGVADKTWSVPPSTRHDEKQAQCYMRASSAADWKACAFTDKLLKAPTEEALGSLSTLCRGCPDSADIQTCIARCQSGDGMSCRNVAYRYDVGKGVAQDTSRSPDYREKAQKLLEADCDRSDRACVDLALVYLFGGGTAKIDTAKGRDLLKKSCEAGSGSSCSLLGSLYRRRRSYLGYETPPELQPPPDGPDEDRAISYYRKGCALKYPKACEELKKAGKEL